MKKDLTIAEILLTMDDGVDRFTVSTMIQNQIDVLVDSSYKEGYVKGRNSAFSSRDAFNLALEKFLRFTGLIIALPVIAAVYWAFHCINEKCEKLDIAETTACSTGQYTQCMSGWTRQIDSPNRDYLRAGAYEEEYYTATGKYLIKDPDSRQFRFTNK